MRSLQSTVRRSTLDPSPSRNHVTYSRHSRNQLVRTCHAASGYLGRFYDRHTNDETDLWAHSNYRRQLEDGHDARGEESRAFAQNFEKEMGSLIGKLQVILCAPITAMSTLAVALKDIPMVDPGAQNSSAFPNPEHSGEISARLVSSPTPVASGAWSVIGK